MNCSSTPGELPPSPKAALGGLDCPRSKETGKSRKWGSLATTESPEFSLSHFSLFAQIIHISE